METTELQILLAEDDVLTLRTNKRILQRFGHVTATSSVQEAQSLARDQKFDLAFFDLNFYGELEGLNLVTIASKAGLYSVVVSAESRSDILETAFKNGTKDYLLKPFNDEKLDQVMSIYFNNRKHLEFEKIINSKFLTKSKKQVDELYKIKNLIMSDKPVFIHGETGTGKRVVSHIIKEISDNNIFLELNCSQFNDELIASELFGHTKGSFTGATDNKEGLLSKANNGTIFLDEIHSLSLKAQKTLLKAIEEKEFYPVGSGKPVKSNFRVISATCEDMNEMLQNGTFREDLYARISTFQVKLFPLRERKEDIGLLFSHYISKHLIQIFITDEARDILKNYSWPRNTREVEDLVENWVVNGNRLIKAETLPAHIRHNIVSRSRTIPEAYLDLVEEYGLNEFLAFMKNEISTAMVKRHGGSIRKAAKVMKSSHSNLAGFMKESNSKNFFMGKQL